jgi:hypothetical protein
MPVSLTSGGAAKQAVPVTGMLYPQTILQFSSAYDQKTSAGQRLRVVFADQRLM